MSETNVQVYENNTHSKFRNVNDRNHLLYLHQLETTSHGNHSDTMQTVKLFDHVSVTPEL